MGEDFPVHQTLPEAGKTPTMPIQEADLAATVDGGSGEIRCDSTPSRRLHVFFTNVGTPPSSEKMA